jgi:hypothetical protein
MTTSLLLDRKCLYDLTEHGFDLFVGELFVLNRPFRHERPLNEMHGQVQVKGWIDFAANSVSCIDRVIIHANSSRLAGDWATLG